MPRVSYSLFATHTQGSAPESPITSSGFPSRRHSSAVFAANRRYSSNALLSPLQSSNQVWHGNSTEKLSPNAMQSDKLSYEA